MMEWMARWARLLSGFELQFEPEWIDSRPSKRQLALGLAG